LASEKPDGIDASVPNHARTENLGTPLRLGLTDVCLYNIVDNESGRFEAEDVVCACEDIEVETHVTVPRVIVPV
jgi:hypothetical protein